MFLHANGEGQNFPAGEWIELYNNGSMTLNLIDYMIMDAMGNVTQLTQANIVTNETQNSTLLLQMSIELFSLLRQNFGTEVTTYS